MKASLLFSLVLLVSCTGKDIRKGEAIIPVKADEVKIENACNTKSYVGTAEESKATTLFCRYPGKLESLNVKKGDPVKEGSVIAVISSQTVLSAKEIADATLKQAMDGYERIKKMHEKGSIADVKMVEIETQLAKARAASVSADKALEDCTIRAPFSGIVGEISVEEGTDVDVMQRIVRLMDISSMEIRFSVPENELAKIHEGEIATISIPALDIEAMEAEVIEKGLCASPLSHTYSCTLRPRGKIAGLMPGMVCKVYMEGSRGQGAIIPSSAIRTDAQGRYVWTVKENIVYKNYIETDGYAEKGVIVRKGLEEGDKIITEGVQKVCTGMKVSIVK